MTQADHYPTESSANIVRTLATAKEPMRASQLKNKLKYEWNTIRNNLLRLEKMGRVHVQYIGGNKYYSLNGKTRHMDKVRMGDNECLWLDIFEPDRNHEQHFVRIKETRRIAPGSDASSWESSGSINIRFENLGEFIEKLTHLKETLETEYNHGENGGSR